MKEKNRHELKRAIKSLPTYEPPEGIWKQIRRELDQAIDEQPLSQAIGQLRTYEPPELVWEGIENALNKKPVRPAKVRSLYRLLGAAAAAILLVMTAVRFWPEQEATPQVVYTIEETAAPAPVFVADWNADEELISDLIKRFENSPKAGQSNGYISLQEELGELNEAKGELEMIMKKYGQDTGTIEQLKEIEMERTNVIKEMASLI